MSTGSPAYILALVFGTMFVYLRLTGQIDWPWGWVVSPFWGVVALDFVVTMIQEL